MANLMIKTESKYDDYDYPTISATNLPGHPGHTTPQQDAQVEQFRMMLEQAGFAQRLDTLTLVRLSSTRNTGNPICIVGFRD